MRIVKKGNFDKEFFFECKDCGCVFALTGKELAEMKREHTNPDGTVSPYLVKCPECEGDTKETEAPAENHGKCESHKKANSEDAGERTTRKIHNCPYLVCSAMTVYKNGKCVKDYAEDWCAKRNKKCPTGGKTDGGICKYL